MRLFAAVYPPQRVSDHLAAMTSTLTLHRPAPPGRSLRLVPERQWHVTVVFLGEVADARLARVERAIAAAAERSRPCGIRIGGGGQFGKGRFTTVWAGLDGEVSGLRSLSAKVCDELRAAHLPYDRKAFRPHLTLARPGDRMSPEQVADDIRSLGSYRGPEWTVEELCLMRSHLGPVPVYDTLLRARLGTAG